MKIIIDFILNNPFLVSLIIFIILLNLKTRKPKNYSDNEESFWETEAKANSTRKKDLSNLHYITIPEKNLPFIETNDEIIILCHKNIRNLMSKKIVNLTSYTNTELKLKYGAANLPTLTEYDNNFTELCQILNKWGTRLLELNFQKEACTVLEYAVSIMSDISNTYKLLGSIYMENKNSGKIDSLITSAEKLNSLSKPIIIRHLNELKDSSVG